MKALTVRQPWATLIALGVKRYETRTRPTNVRGRVAIHAGLSEPCAKGVTARFVKPNWWISHFVHDGLWLQFEDGNVVPLPLGAIVATAELVDCVPTDAPKITWPEYQIGDWTPGRWAWRLDDVRPLAVPVPAKGRQGWWEWDET